MRMNYNITALLRKVIWVPVSEPMQIGKWQLIEGVE